MAPPSPCSIICLAAAWALIALGEASGAGPVHDIVSRVSVQDQPRLERGAARLSRRADTKALERQVEGLTERLRAMEAKLEELSVKP